MREKYSKPIVEEFFRWIDRYIDKSLLFGKSAPSKAAIYTLNQAKGLRVCLVLWSNLNC